MQRNTIIIAAIVAVAAVAICLIGAVVVLQLTSQPKGEPTLAPSPSLEPPVSPTPGGAADDSWQRIQASGRIVVGTSADYPPFEYMTEDDQVDGFDVALMNAISRNLGISVEWHQIAFDGLVDAVRAGQIDAAIAGISISDERQALVDFSNIYHSGEDAFLANASSSLDGIDEAGDLSSLRVGAQGGTVYESYLQGLVDRGQLSQVFRYEAATDAVRDLRQDRLDLVMLDALPAQAFVDEGGVKIAGGGLDQQLYAIALPKGATSLRDQINNTLIDLQNQGVIAQLNKQYLNLEPEHILPTPTPTPPPAATNTPAPPPPCSKALELVEHLDYDDKNGTDPPVLSPGQSFTKTWRVRNTGTCTWDSSYRLAFASGGRMGGQPVGVQGQVEPEATYDISVNLVAPNKGGSHKGFWQMEDSTSTAFGETLPVRIWVASPATPSPPPTPVPGITFNVDRDHIDSGECVNFYWKVENVQAVYFYHDGQNWQDHGVAGEGNSQECPPHTLTYYLRVQFHDGSVDQRQITIWVEDTPNPPDIVSFTLNPNDHIRDDGTITIRWEVHGDVDDITIYQEGNWLFDTDRTADSARIQPNPRLGQTEVKYDIYATGPDGDDSASAILHLSGSLPPTDTPTPPPPEEPTINAFNVVGHGGSDPTQVVPGGCVDISWQVSGPSTGIQIVSGARELVKGAAPSDSYQDCNWPGGPGDTVPYRIVVYYGQDKHKHAGPIEIQIVEPQN